MKSKSRTIVLIVLILSLRISLAASAQTESLDELYKKAVKEEGVVNCYCSLAQINAEKIYPVFEKRFPGIKINHVDATSDKLSARAITEARGGRVIADVVGEPRVKGRLIGEPLDYEILIGMTHKHKSLEKARAILARIAANDVEFHKGHSELAEFLVAGQAAACFTCYSHHYPARIRKGAPLNYMLSEGVAGIIAISVLKSAPHPNTAWLFARWASSAEGQAVYAKGGRTPAHPKVEPTEKIRPATIYAVGVEDLKQYSKFEKIWKEVFKLR